MSFINLISAFQYLHSEDVELRFSLQKFCDEQKVLCDKVKTYSNFNSNCIYYGYKLYNLKIIASQRGKTIFDVLDFSRKNEKKNYWSVRDSKNLVWCHIYVWIPGEHISQHRHKKAKV